MRLLATTIALAAAAGLAACGGDDSGNADAGSSPSASGAVVSVKAFSFDPDPVRVEPGTKVTWTNEDATTHTVTSGTRKKPDGQLDGRLAESGGKFSATFDRPGTHKYFCSLHSGPGMTATVIVE